MAIALGAHAANLTLVPVDSFGESLTACHVVAFLGQQTAADEHVELASRFRGLQISPVPLGQYEATVRCEEGAIHREIVIDREDQIALMARSARIFISEHTKPELLIRSEMPFAPQDLWWIRLIGLYNAREYVSQFLPGTNMATIIDPDPGSYLVIVLSKGGYVCSQEIDLVEGTKQWSFNRRDCSFQFDRFAHLVTNEDKRNSKSGSWYQQIKKDNDLLFRQLRDAAGKQ